MLLAEYNDIASQNCLEEIVKLCKDQVFDLNTCFPYEEKIKIKNSLASLLIVYGQTTVLKDMLSRITNPKSSIDITYALAGEYLQDAENKQQYDFYMVKTIDQTSVNVRHLLEIVSNLEKSMTNTEIDTFDSIIHVHTEIIKGIRAAFAAENRKLVQKDSKPTDVKVKTPIELLADTLPQGITHHKTEANGNTELKLVGQDTYLRQSWMY